MAATRLVITGRVQGVFYRDWTVATARALGLAGWVRNRRDGSVEVHAEGDAAALGAFVTACRSGPERARVDHVAASDVPAEGCTTFDRRPTA